MGNQHKALVLIDGENFRNYVKRILVESGETYTDDDYNSIDLKSLINKIFLNENNIEIKQIKYYVAKISLFAESLKYSQKKISGQRKLKMSLEKQGINFIVSGHVRRQNIIVNEKTKHVFHEKGVDVGLAVDIMSQIIDKQFDTIVLCSSDSDLQPAVKEARKRGLSIIYLGFSINPNKGLQVTTNQTVLFRNSEIISILKQKNLNGNKSKLR